MAVSGSVGQAERIITQLETELGGQAGIGFVAAHITVYRKDGLIGKDIKQGQIGEITGMDNGVAVGKTVFHKFQEGLVYARQVGVGKYACLYHKNLSLMDCESLSVHLKG